MCWAACWPEARLEPDLPDLLWSVVNVFHRKSDRVQRDLDDNEDRQRRAQQERVRRGDRSTGTPDRQELLERRDAFELLRSFEARLAAPRPHARLDGEPPAVSRAP